MIMDVSVIIVNYNTARITCESIESVLKKTELLKFEIIVIDNRSSDNSIELISARFNDKVRLVSSGANIGFGQANNMGIKLSTGRNIFFLNPDTILLNNAIKILSDYVDGHPETGSAGPNLFDKHNRPGFSFRRFLPSAFWEINDLLFTFPEKLLFGRNKFFNFTGRPLKTGYISGAALMIRKEILEKAGFFDPDYFLYFEETDLIKRIKRLGYSSVNNPRAEIMHLEGVSFEIDTARTEYYMKGKYLYYQKWFTPWCQSIIHFIITLTFISRIFTFRILSNHPKVAFWRSLYRTYSDVKKSMVHEINRSKAA
jgi:GT2 family glycosyltransferase